MKVLALWCEAALCWTSVEIKLPRLLPKSSLYQATKLIVSSKFVFSEHISSAAATKHGWINSLSSTWLSSFSRQRSHLPVYFGCTSFSLFIFMKKIGSVEMVPLKFSGFPDHCFLVNWEYRDNCLVWQWTCSYSFNTPVVVSALATRWPDNKVAVICNGPKRPDNT